MARFFINGSELLRINVDNLRKRHGLSYTGIVTDHTPSRFEAYHQEQGDAN